MKKQKKKYSRPQTPFDKVRIDEENILKERYGLKNKKEIWKADAQIGKIRNLAKKLITASDEDKNAFVERLKKKGFEVESIADALGLDKEDLLKRRLQTIVFKKGFANKPKQARQFITHKHVSIGERVVNIPSYQVSLEEENLVKCDIVLKVKEEKKDKLEEIKEGVVGGDGVVDDEKSEDESNSERDKDGSKSSGSDVVEDTNKGEVGDKTASESEPNDVKEESKEEGK